MRGSATSSTIGATELPNHRLEPPASSVKRMIKAGVEANRYIRSNREGTVQFLMEWMRTDEVAAATYESLLLAFNDDGNCPEDAMGLVIDEAKKRLR